MLFDGPACTAEAGATGDRWCAFVARGVGQARDLFVVNVSRVVAGDAVTCTGGNGDPNCLRLTAALGGDSFDPTEHGTLFQGDTLIYYDDRLIPYAWRPGMLAGRRLVDAAPGGVALDSVFCTPAPRGTAAICLGLPPAQADPDLSRAELLIGTVDGTREPPLQVADTVITANVADLGSTPRFSVGFPPGPDDDVAWSGRATATGPEILKLQRADDLASQVVVATDVNAWDISPDGRQWFWLAGIDRAGIGTLQTSSFPAGTNPSAVVPATVSYGFPAAAGSVAVLTRTGALQFIADPVAAPAISLTLDTQVQVLLSFGAQGHIAYVKHFFGANLVDVFVKQQDGGGACTVDATTRTPLRSMHFSPDGGAAVTALSRNSTATAGFDGFYTRLTDCTSMPVAPDVVVLAAVGDGILLFMDDFDSTTATGTMRFRTVGDGNLLHPTSPATIAGHVDTYALSGPGPEHDKGTLVYTVHATEAEDGVYVRWFGP